MIELNQFIKVPNLNKTKIKFNMNAGNVEIRAWDLLLKKMKLNGNKLMHGKRNIQITI